MKKTLSILALLFACKQETAQLLKTSQKPFAFDYKASTEIFIAKADPAAGDNWSTRIIRVPNSTSETEWEIVSAPDGQTLIDTKANGTYILHLLDTMRGLQVTTIEKSGPPESFGLSPPRFAIRWKAPKENKQTEEFEIRLGNPVGKNSDTENGVYATIPSLDGFSPNQIVSVNGSTLKMLEFLSSFSAIRLQNWINISSDDIDEIEIFSKKARTLYAQREGPDWTDRAHKPVKYDVQKLLDKLTHAKIEEFLDDRGFSEKLRVSIEKDPAYGARFTDRHGKSVVVSIKWVSTKRANNPSGVEKLLGISSSRPDAVFVLYPKIEEFFKPPF